MIVASLAAVGSSAPAAAEKQQTSPAATSADSTPSSQTAGKKLKWLPYRPDSGQSADRDPSAGRIVPAASVEPAKTSTGQSQAVDPFGDESPASGAKQLFTPNKTDFAASALPDNPPSIDSAAAEVQTAPTRAVKPEPAPLARPSDRTDAGSRLDSPSFRGSSEAFVLPTRPQPETLEQICALPERHKINEITTEISAEKGDFPPECPVKGVHAAPTGPTGERNHGKWSQVTYTWTASALCHKPLYFEDVQLERYGHTWGPYVQPIVSGGKFFLTFPVLPYFMGVCPPSECEYTLGYYRPGNCAPYMLEPFPWSARAALVEGGAWTAAVFIF